MYQTQNNLPDKNPAGLRNQLQDNNNTRQIVRASQPVMIHDGKRIVTIGKWYPDAKVFEKTIKPEHILRIPPAIAIQSEIISKLKALDCKRVIVKVSDGRILESTFTNIVEYGFSFDRGFGRQWALALQLWTDNKKPKQADLFGGEV